MKVWKHEFALESLNAMCAGTLAEHLGIEFLEVGDDYLKARMPVDHRTHQPMGILHGGASAALAETIGSMAANMCLDMSKEMCVGLEINANHVRPVPSGHVYAEARPLHMGRTTHVWDIRISNEAGKLACISRLTLAILPIPGA